jgi:hypothetical protein
VNAGRYKGASTNAGRFRGASDAAVVGVMSGAGWAQTLQRIIWQGTKRNTASAHGVTGHWQI